MKMFRTGEREISNTLGAWPSNSTNSMEEDFLYQYCLSSEPWMNQIKCSKLLLRQSRDSAGIWELFRSKTILLIFKPSERTSDQIVWGAMAWNLLRQRTNWFTSHRYKEMIDQRDLRAGFSHSDSAQPLISLSCWSDCRLYRGWCSDSSFE